MANAVYVMCAIASLTCAILLQRAWSATRAPLLFWSAVCFAGLALNNALLVTDFVLVPGHDLSLLRSTVALASLAALIYGLVWDVERRQ